MFVSRCAYVKVRALGTHVWVVVGGLDDAVVNVAKRAFDDQSAQHAVREGELYTIDARVALCAC